MKSVDYINIHVIHAIRGAKSVSLHAPSEPAALVPLTQEDIAECPAWQAQAKLCALLRIPRFLREPKIHEIPVIRGEFFTTLSLQRIATQSHKSRNLE